MTEHTRLPLNVLANVGNVGAGIAVALITTPLILTQVGTAGYGVWTIALSFVLYLAIAEQGFGPAAQRFVAVSKGRGDPRASSRIMWTALAGYAVIGLVAMTLLVALAGPIISLFDIPDHLHGDAVNLIKLVGFTLPIALAAAALGNVQAGLERFPAEAAATIAGSLAYLILLAALVALDANLFQLGFAVVGQQLVMLLMRVVMLRHLIASGRPAMVSRPEIGELLRYSGKLQVSVLSVLINGQSDRVVVGLVAPAATVGQVGIAAQFSEAGRLVGAAVLTPVISRLSTIHGAGDHRRLHAEFQLLNQLWMLTVMGATLIGVASVYPILTAWLGSGHGQAVEFAMVLVFAYGISLIPGTRVAYLRAINQIGPEVSTGAITLVFNVALTIPLAIIVGPFGVVIGTLVAYVIGAAWLIYRFNSYAPPVSPIAPRVLVRGVIAAALAAAVAAGWGSAMVQVLPAPAALIPVVLGLAAVLIAYLSAVTRQRPSRANLRRWLAGGPPPVTVQSFR